MTPATIDHKLMDSKLKQLLEITGSDLTAIGAVDQSTRKFRWLTVVGSINNRTCKIRQHIQLGLTGEVLRTGSFIQHSPKSIWEKQVDEPIFLTEKLSHAAAWPIAINGSYLVSILIGRRQSEIYGSEQIAAGTKLVYEISAHCCETMNIQKSKQA